MRRGRAIAVVAVLIVVIAVVLALAGIFAAHQSAKAPATGTTGGRPLSGAHAVQQASICTGYTTYPVPLVTPLPSGRTYNAVVTTNFGRFTIHLLPMKAPTTVASFIFLAQHHYFDNVSVDRVVPGFVIQGGDPTGSGACGPGYEFPDENLGGPYHRGDVAMANSGPNTNGSQFFVVLRDGTVLDQMPNYSLFGHVTAGMSTVDKIATVKLGPRDMGNGQTEMSVPQTKVIMTSVRIAMS